MTEWGIFNDEAADWSREEAIEDEFFSKEEAEAAIRDRYCEDDELTIHEIEEGDQ